MAVHFDGAEPKVTVSLNWSPPRESLINYAGSASLPQLPALTLTIMQTMDEIRRQIKLKYPMED